MFNPCIVIPYYRHERAIGALLERLRPHGLTCWIVDDGSGGEAAQVVRELVQREPDWLRLLVLPQNSGKGVAVMSGCAAAAEAGFTHALQIDADGQHDTADVPRFLAEGLAHPRALVCGQPIYDDSVPRARLYGRYVTHVCVWMETLSFTLRDSMCGYRLYPLEATCAEIDRKPLPARMDFDTEVAVRLVWRGVAVRNLPTRVIYPANGLSHFHMLHDNLRISAMHTRLLLGMLPRAPVLLWRKRRRSAWAA
jgi:glycosyltransferase involved in cell wall biosynthesis